MRLYEIDYSVLAVQLTNLNDFSVPVDFDFLSTCGEESGGGGIPAHGLNTWKSTPCPTGGYSPSVFVRLFFFP